MQPHGSYLAGGWILMKQSSMSVGTRIYIMYILVVKL